MADVDSKGAIDIPSRLVELDRLPSVLGRLTDSRTVLLHALLTYNTPRLLLLVLLISRVLSIDVPLDLILSKSQW